MIRTRTAQAVAVTALEPGVGAPLLPAGLDVLAADSLPPETGTWGG